MTGASQAPSASRGSSGAEAYTAKNAQYFTGVRRDYVEELPVNHSCVLLDIGCGHGATGALALQLGKCGTAYGIEIEPMAAAVASEALDEVLIGDVEELPLPWPESSVDVLVLSEILEHLRDPWSVLRKVRPLLKPNARVFASSPNVAHHRIIRGVLRGRWHLTEYGPMDKTHLRWFTPRTYRQMFEECGYVVHSVGPLDALSSKGKVFNVLTLGRLTHILCPQIDLRATPTQVPAA